MSNPVNGFNNHRLRTVNLFEGDHINSQFVAGIYTLEYGRRVKYTGTLKIGEITNTPMVWTDFAVLVNHFACDIWRDKS